MPREYSLYEAKTHLSALVRQVREGRTVVITVHGRPVAELRPVAEPAGKSLESRLADLEAQGVVTPAGRSPRDYAEIRARTRPRKRPGGLKRFLDDRG